MRGRYPIAMRAAGAVAALSTLAACAASAPSVSGSPAPQTDPAHADAADSALPARSRLGPHARGRDVYGLGAREADLRRCAAGLVVVPLTISTK